MKCDYSLEGFYKPYGDYLRLPEVRQEHDRIFTLFYKLVGNDIHAVDLGCATCEFGKWLMREGKHGYTGIDLNESCKSNPCHVLTGDYRSSEFEYVYDECNAFVSIFSTECHLDSAEKYEFYEKLFSHPRMKFGLVAGFIYDEHPHDFKIQERLGFEVYQTVESQIDFRNPIFDEWRCAVRVPPGMFGDPFTEVWKIMVRK